ncbi:CLUMA_CG004331, isoform A [Clunio marinus]|uniref:RNA methyltransferase n=1 Tax=Clunio marinus TaxID=568069 RepID=A0A1J1HRI0_9DIPT|nr:CLUMA_CG004331, isoform A [Clunio marinus]
MKSTQIETRGKCSENNKNKRKFVEFKYGNYSNYYFKRFKSESIEKDSRITLFESHPEFFRHKKILDIGCNSGYITIQIAKKLSPTEILGVDLDGNLIDQARRDLEIERKTSKLEITKEVLNRVSFRKANYILKDESLLEFENPLYDTILCLSITKWIHLNHGDNGIKFMFKRIYKQLKTNGALILEAQEFNSYKKRSKLSPEILENFKNIKLKPNAFEAYLLSDEIGFSESWFIADKKSLKESGQPKGFHRAIQVFVKR